MNNYRSYGSLFKDFKVSVVDIQCEGVEWKDEVGWKKFDPCSEERLLRGRQAGVVGMGSDEAGPSKRTRVE